MSAQVRTVIIGAGQAGLAVSRCLTAVDHEHIVLDRGRVAERWRSERWDSFRLLTPNWQSRLPGWQYTGPEPGGFMTGREVVGFFDGYARSFQAPVVTGAEVWRVEPAATGWRVWTTQGVWLADNVVVATGHYDQPSVPPLAASLPADLQQIHTRDYRNPAQLPDGGVLVVGSGPSGQQIADEVARSGRTTYLAVGRHRPLPRRYRGRDVYDWMEQLGLLDRTVDTLPDPKAAQYAPSVVLSGDREDLNLRRLVRNGVVPAGRLQSVEAGTARFAADLADRLAEADANVRKLQDAVDGYVLAHGLLAPVEAARPPGPAPWADSAPSSLDLRQVSTVVWATGFQRGYSWLQAPVFDRDGEVLHRRGVSVADGLFFIGLRWMYRRKSNFIDGVGEDAVHLAGAIDARARDRSAVA